MGAKCLGASYMHYCISLREETPAKCPRVLLPREAPRALHEGQKKIKVLIARILIGSSTSLLRISSITYNNLYLCMLYVCDEDERFRITHGARDIRLCFQQVSPSPVRGTSRGAAQVLFLVLLSSSPFHYSPGKGTQSCPCTAQSCSGN